MINIDIYKTVYDQKTLLYELKKITPDVVINYIVQMFNNVSLTSFIYGCVDKEKILNLFNEFNKLLCES